MSGMCIGGNARWAGLNRANPKIGHYTREVKAGTGGTRMGCLQGSNTHCRKFREGGKVG